MNRHRLSSLNLQSKKRSLDDSYFSFSQNIIKRFRYMKAKETVDFFSVRSREEVAEIDKRIEESQRNYDAKLRDRMMKAKDFPMTD